MSRRPRTPSSPQRERVGLEGPLVKWLDRPPLVHMKKEIMGSAGVTRCGIPYEANDREPTRTTAWYSECTCDECSPS